MQRHEEYPDMYWVEWEDGYRDFFNKTWALEHERLQQEENEVLHSI